MGTTEGVTSRDALDILIIGPVPPPFGGISVHVRRLASLLSRRGYRVGVLNHFAHTDGDFVVGALNKSPVRYYRRPREIPARVAHYHHSRWEHLIAFALGERRQERRRILTLHAGDIEKHFPQLVSKVPLVRRITLWALRQFDVVVTVDPIIADIVRRESGHARVVTVPAFLEPARDETAGYEPALREFVSRGPVLVAAAYGVQFLRDGSELYGLDTAVSAFIQISHERRDLSLALFIAQHPSTARARRHLLQLEESARGRGVGDRLRIAYGQPLLPALRENAIFIRPTRAEGDAVSVREARIAGVPVVASDVVRRPAGVLTFAVGDSADLVRALREILDKSSADRKDAVRTPADGFADELLALYKEELAEVARASGSVRDSSYRPGH